MNCSRGIVCRKLRISSRLSLKPIREELTKSRRDLFEDVFYLNSFHTAVYFLDRVCIEN